MEIGKVLRGEKFRWPEEEIRKAQRRISTFIDHVTAVETLNVVTVDPADNRILECAMAAESDYVVTGDDHLLRPRRYNNARLLKVADFLEILRVRAI